VRGDNAAVRAVVLAIVALPAIARADDKSMSADTFAVQPPGQIVVDAGFLVALPSSLPAGLSTGVAAGITRACGCHLGYGAIASWSSASATSESWTVTHGELRLRATGELRHDAGRGTLALRLGLGASVVHEDRVRNQGERAGLMGSALEQTATAGLPAADLAAVVALRVIGPWAFQIAGGPTVTWEDSHLRGGWSAEIGVAWHP
jgi:hypothetical protein